MNREKLIKKTRSTAAKLLQEKKFVSPVDLLMNMDVLSNKDYENWRMGRIPYMEQAAGMNLSKLSLIRKELKAFAADNRLNPSKTGYNGWGKKRKKIKLRFSKSGNPKIEEAYATHFCHPSLKKSVQPAKKHFDYVTKLDIKFDHLQPINIAGLVEKCEDKWFNQTLTKVNDSVVRLGIVEGEYHWHKHDEDDEFFFVLSGQLLIDLEDRTIELNPNEGVTISKGLLHRPRTPVKTVMLMVETSSIEPTGTHKK